MERPDTRDFDAEIRSQVNDVLVPKYEKNMPFRLLDTYTGLILERSEIVSLLKTRRDYHEKVDDAVAEARRLAVPRSPPERPKLDCLDAFIAEFLAYAMFSHRWGEREPTLQDVRQADRGIYFMEDKDILEATPKPLRMPRNETNDFPTAGVEKLQEFCCLVAKCGYRWAWSDTCCINKTDYAETSESINCMFLWYRSSDLTIVYLSDVDDVKGGRLSPLDDDQWFRDIEMKTPLPPSGPSVSPSPSDTYVEPFHTEKQYLSLYDRLRDVTYPQLQSMHPDTQVEKPQLDYHLADYFPSSKDCSTNGKYRKPPVWVSRGWTLQELVAPKRLRFYSKEWKLLEEAEDFDTEEAECKICISSFKRRARLIDHRTNDLWSDALVNTTGVRREDLTNFEPGTRDVRARLLWAAKRTTTKAEDMAYCLLGIFGVSLPAIYGEGPRAFFRLQEELMKRTGDVSLFDWCGRSSSVNSFLAHDPRCFIEPGIPEPELPPSNKSPLKMILDLFYAILGTSLSGLEAAILTFKDWVLNVLNSPSPGHTLVNGELNVSLFEHQVCKCTPLDVTLGVGYHHYQIEGEGLEPTAVTLASNLVGQPAQYYLCRIWDRHTKNVFQVLLDLIKYVLQDVWKEVLSLGQDKAEYECPEPPAVVEVEDDSQRRLREAMETKRRQVMHFFKDDFPVYLVRAEEGRRVRVNTVKRVMVEYSRKHDFTKPLMMRMIM